MADKPLKSITFPDLPDRYTIPQIDTVLETAGMAADAKATGDELTDLKSALNETADSVFRYEELPINTTASGWRLRESNGLCESNSSYKLVKYQVVGGQTVKVISDDRFQFQTVASVPSGGTNNRVGITYGTGEYVLVVPATATYLIVSTPATGSIATAYIGKDNIKENKEKIETVVCPNLMGMVKWKLYPVDFKDYQYLTVSTSDGSLFSTDSSLRIILYDSNKDVVNYYALANGQSYYNIQLSDANRESTKYLSWNGTDSVPLMVNFGKQILPYVEYQEPVRKLIADNTIKIEDLMTGEQTGSIKITSWENGTFSSNPPGLTESETRLRFKNFYKVYAGDKVRIINNGFKSYIGIWEGTIESPTLIVNEGWNVEDKEYMIVEDGFFVVAFANSDTSTKINVDTFTGEVYVSTWEKVKGEYDILTTLDGWEQGSFSKHTRTTTSVRLRHMDIIQVEKMSTIYLDPNSGVEYKVVFYDDYGYYVGEYSWQTGLRRFTEKMNIRLMMRMAGSDSDSITLDNAGKLKLNLIVRKTPELKVHVVSQISVGDCMILKTSDNKAMLIDIGREADYNRLKNALSYEGISKLDYIIVSHYHGDHINVSGVTNLISDFDLSSCVFVLPPAIPAAYQDPDDSTNAVYERQNAIIALLEQNNISYVNEYWDDTSQMWLCGIRFDFYNLNQDSWYSNNDDYNQMSIVCIANIGKNSIFFTGDMGQPLETKLIDIIDRTVNIAKFGHHGLNNTGNYDFWRKLKPDVFFATVPELWHEDLLAASYQMRYANYNHIKNIITRTTGDIYIRIGHEGYSINGYNYVLDNLSSSEYFNFVM